MRHEIWAATIGIAAASICAEAARLPDWAKQVRDAAPAVPEGVSKHAVRGLLHQNLITYAEEGTRRSIIRVAKQSLSQARQDAGIESSWFGPKTKLKSSKAWHLPPDGATEKASASDSIDVALNDAFLSDSRQRLIGFDGMKRGSLVFFEFQDESKPYTLDEVEYFLAEPGGTLVRELELTVPAGWTVQYDWLGGPRLEPTVTGTRYLWRVQNLPAQDDDERLAGAPLDRTPRLVINLIPPAGSDVALGSFANWDQFGNWYGKLNEKLPALAELPSELRHAAANDAVTDLIHSARFVRDKIRYVAALLGTGAFISRPAQETLNLMWGDCKAKTTLLNGILSHRQIEAYPVLVNLTHRRSVSESVPGLYAFNHLVSAVQLDSSSSAQLGDAPARLDHPTRGPLWIVDTTDEFMSIGSISGSLAGKRALIVTPSGSQLVTLPGTRSQDHRIERELTVSLGASASIQFVRTSRYFGGPAGEARRDYRASATDREKSLLRRVRETWVDADKVAYQATPETASGEFEEQLAWTVRELPLSGDQHKLELFPTARDWFPMVSLSKRKLPVIYDHPLTQRFVTIVDGIPANHPVPVAKSQTGEGWSVTSQYQRDGTRLTASLEIILERTEFPPADFESLKTFNSAISAASGLLFLP